MGKPLQNRSSSLNTLMSTGTTLPNCCRRIHMRELKFDSGPTFMIRRWSKYLQHHDFQRQRARKSHRGLP
ncbi:unnamed protein product, partial [Vitis vinifera]